jgi:hypothetical protein
MPDRAKEIVVELRIVATNPCSDRLTSRAIKSFTVDNHEIMPWLVYSVANG